MNHLRDQVTSKDSYITFTDGCKYVYTLAYSLQLETAEPVRSHNSRKRKKKKVSSFP